MSHTISVIVPLHQGAPFIEATLASVAAQTRAPRDIVVIDDHSRDDGARRAARFPGVEVHVARGHGPAAARQQALELARGTRIAFLDQDDIWAADHLAGLSTALDRHPEAAFVWAPMRSWRGDPARLPTSLSGTLAEQWIDPWTTLPSCAVSTPSCVMVERDRLTDIGGWSPAVEVADLHTYLLLACRGPALRTARISVAYRQSPDSNSRRLRRDPAPLLAAQVRTVQSALRWREARHGPCPAAHARLQVMARLPDLLQADPVVLAAFCATLRHSDCDPTAVVSHLQWLRPDTRDPALVLDQLARLQQLGPVDPHLLRALARGVQATALCRGGWYRPRLWPILAGSLLERTQARWRPN